MEDGSGSKKARKSTTLANGSKEQKGVGAKRARSENQERGGASMERSLVETRGRRQRETTGRDRTYALKTTRRKKRTKRRESHGHRMEKGRD